MINGIKLSEIQNINPSVFVLEFDFLVKANSLPKIPLHSHSFCLNHPNLTKKSEKKIKMRCNRNDFCIILYLDDFLHTLPDFAICMLSIREWTSFKEKSNRIFPYDFDIFFIDCPPSLGILTINSLVAADSVLIPLQCEYYALEGLGQLLKVIAIVQENLNKKLRLEGVILTMYDSRTNLSQQVVSDVRKHFRDKVLNTIVPRNVKLSEAPSFGKPIGHYDRKSVGSQSYERLAEEVLRNG